MNISLLYANYAERSRLDWQLDGSTMFLVKALRYVVQEVLAHLAISVVMTTATQNLDTGDRFVYLMEELLISSNGISVQLLRFKSERTEHVPGRKFCNFLMLDSYEGLLAVNLASDNAQYDDLEYYFIFLQLRDMNIVQQLQLILNYCLHNYWLHCNVMIQTTKGEVLVYTYFPYTPQHCQAALPVLINRFDGVRMLHDIMFPDKLDDLHGCRLVLLTWNMPPFVRLTWNDAAAQLQASGLEIILVEHLARRLNFRLQLRNLTLTYVGNYLLANGTMLGPIELLTQKLANLSVGYFRKTARRNMLLTSPLTHYYSPLVATVEPNSYRIGSLALLTFPFQLEVWLLLLFVVALHLTVYTLRWRSSGFQVVELLLGAALWRLPRQWAQRLIYAHWLFGSIPLRVVYQSLLFHLIRLQMFSTLPSSLEQLLGRNFLALSTPNTLQMLEETPLYERYVDSFSTVGSSVDYDVLDVLLQRQQQNEHKLFAITARDVASSYLSAHNRLEDYYMVPQYISLQQVGIYLPKHSYFNKKFADIMRRLLAGGFMSTWQHSSFGQRKQQTTEHQMYISNRELLGIYTVMAVMYGLASLTLLLELLLHRWLLRK